MDEIDGVGAFRSFNPQVKEGGGGWNSESGDNYDDEPKKQWRNIKNARITEWSRGG